MDLYYRLSWAVIELLPLRKRRDDILLMAAHYLTQSLERHGKSIYGFSPQAMNVIWGRDYPGNVRKLSQVVESAVLLGNDKFIQPAHLGSGVHIDDIFERTPCSLNDNTLAHVAFIQKHTQGDVEKAAKIFKINPQQAYRRVAEMKKTKWSGYTS